MVSEAQARYAMKVSYHIARRHGLNAAINYEDLAMCAVERIMVELGEHDHLHTYNGWMRKVAKWAIADELRRMHGRPGITRQGKMRVRKAATYSLERMAIDGFAEIQADQEDHDLRLDLDAMIDNSHHRDTLRLVQMGYSYTEIGRIMGVTPAAISQRMETVRRENSLATLNPSW